MNELLGRLPGGEALEQAEVRPCGEFCRAPVARLAGLGLSAHWFAELRAEVGATLPLVALEFAGSPVGLINAPGLLGALALGATW